MVHVSLRLEDGTLLDNLKFSLKSQQIVFTNKPNSEGRWYYEVTHLRGDGCASFGYTYNIKKGNTFIIASNGKSYDHFYVYYYNSVNIFLNSSLVSNRYSPIEDIGLYQSQYTVGIGFDTYSGIFSIYYNNFFHHMNVSCENCGNKVMPIFIEATGSKIFEDVLNANFGETTFKYGLPSGYKPWNSIWRKETCQMRIHFFNHFFQSFFLFSFFQNNNL